MPQTAFKQDAQVDLEGFDPALVSELEPKLINLMQQSEALVALMRGFFQQLDQRRSVEFRIIAGYIARAKEEIREIRPNDISADRIPTAGAELEAITRDTENATHAIMNSAEAILGMDASDPDYKTKVDDYVMQIFEACSFQDITGQRVSKVVNVLKQIEDRVGKLAHTLGIEDKPSEMTAAEKRNQDLLLNGPALHGPETRQDAIDAMFDGSADVDDVPVVETENEVETEAEFAPMAQSVPQPTPQPAMEPAGGNDQNAIDALFDFTVPEEKPADPSKPASQDDIDALFD